MTYNVILYAYESVAPVRLRVLRDYPCADGDAILAAIYGICELIEFDANEFDMDIEGLRDTSGFTDSNFVLLDPIGDQDKAYALVGIVVARADALATRIKDGYLLPEGTAS